MTEFELKFEIPPASLKSVAVDVLEGKATRQRLQASYFDTADGALAAHGIVVRLRKEGRRWVQTAKAPTADLLERLEHNAVLPTCRAGVVPALELSRHRSRSFDEMEQWGDDLTSFDLVLALSPASQRRAQDLTRFSHLVVEYWPILDPTGLGEGREDRLRSYRQSRDMIIQRLIERWGPPQLSL